MKNIFPDEKFMKINEPMLNGQLQVGKGDYIDFIKIKDDAQFKVVSTEETTTHINFQIANLKSYDTTLTENVLISKRDLSAKSDISYIEFYRKREELND